MPNYTGYHCPVCGKPFTATDDIVVCPDCGAPHHRECYRGLGHCAYEDKHSTQHHWQPEPGEQEAQAQNSPPPQGGSTAVCPRCGSNNPGGNIFCQVCGQQLTQGSPTGQPYGYQPNQPNQPNPGYQPNGYQPSGYQANPGQANPQQNPQQAQPQGQPQNPFYSFIQNQIDYNAELAPGVSTREVCDYVGPNNLPFALRFQTMRQQKNGLSVNWSAFFFSFLYCFYRKMYKLGTVLTVVVAASMIPVFVYAYPFFGEVLADQGALTIEALTAFTSPASDRFAIASLVFRTVLFCVNMFCGFYFNRSYFKAVCKNILSLRQNGHFSSGSSEYTYALARKGGVNSNAVLLVVCTLMVLYILVCIVFTYTLML